MCEKACAFGTTVNGRMACTRRGSKQVNFIALNDGSATNNVQIIVMINLVDILETDYHGAVSA